MEYRDTLIAVGGKEYASIEEYEKATGDTKMFQNIKNSSTMDFLKMMSNRPRPVYRTVSPGARISKFSIGDEKSNRKVIATIRTNCGMITVYDNNSLFIKDYVGPPNADVSGINCSNIDRFVTHLKECGIIVDEIVRV